MPDRIPDPLKLPDPDQDLELPDPPKPLKLPKQPSTLIKTEDVLDVLDILSDPFFWLDPRDGLKGIWADLPQESVFELLTKLLETFLHSGSVGSGGADLQNDRTLMLVEASVRIGKVMAQIRNEIGDLTLPQGGHTSRWRISKGKAGRPKKDEPPVVIKYIRA